MELSSTGVYISLAITAAIGFWAVYRTKKSIQTAAEYFTAKGFLDTKRIFFSVFATTFSAFTVVGLPAMFYAHGIGTFWFMWVGIALTPLTLYFIGRKIVNVSNENKGKFTSPVGLLSNGYDSQSLTVVLSVITIIVLFPYLTLQIAGVGKFLVGISNGSLGYTFGTIFCCAIVGIYIVSGGAKADAETDLIQGAILIFGTLAVGFVLVSTFGNSFQESMSKLNELELLTIPGPRNYFSYQVLFSYGIIFTLISISTPQVSQKLMGIENINDLMPLIRWYAPIGTIVIILAGLMGLFAAGNLEINSPDFVSGDVIRHLSENLGGISHSIFLIISILFIAAIISAAVSTIDSLLLSVTGIVSDNFYEKDKPRKPLLKVLTVAVLIVGLILSSKPPLFIVTLAQIQLAGLTSLVPCLLGPLFNIKSQMAGWLALGLGITPVIAGLIFGVSFWEIEVGLIGFIGGLLGLFLGKSLDKIKNSA